MENQEWNGEELFKHEGRFIFIVQRMNSESQIIADFETGICETVPCQDYDSASLKELEEIA